MKKILSAFTCLVIGTGVLLAQKTELDKLPVEALSDNWTAKEVGYMAVFPGCEKIDVNDKAALQRCLSKEINQLLGDKLYSFTDKMESMGITTAVAKLQFVIDKDGKIVQVKQMSGGNQELGEASEKALNEIAMEIEKIQPAALNDGKPINLFFQLPVKYVIQQETKLKDFNFTEIVVATLKSKDEKFEIRENKKESSFKVYEVQNNEQLFLGKFNSLDEVLSSDPYKTLFISNIDKILLAEKEIDQVLYRIYYSIGQFENVEVYQVVEKQEKLMQSLPQLELQYSSLYLQIILR